MTASWFADDGQTSPKEREFLSAVRDAAVNWKLPNLTPADTAYHPTERLLWVTVPGLTCRHRNLHVAYEAEDDGTWTLRGEWADEYVFDGPEDAGDLYVRGLAATPEQLGGWAAAWLERQLRRPVVRSEWLRPTTGIFSLLATDPSEVVARQWSFTDTDEFLEGENTLIWWWLVKRPADRQSQERPDRGIAS